ncbi:MAG: PEP-CTERM sorting domain-containing protein [Vicinamibacterales bacterium]
MYVVSRKTSEARLLQTQGRMEGSVMRKILLAAGIVFLASTNQASASIIYTFAGVTDLGGPGPYQFAYDANLSADQKIDSSLQGGDAFSVIYDFGGYVGGSYTITNIVAGLTVVPSVEFTTVPQPVLTVSPDNAGIVNLRADITGFYDGTGTIFRVLANSTFSLPNGLIYQAAQARKDTPGSLDNNTLTGNALQVVGPTEAPPTVPEPTSMLLLGSGLVGAALRMRRKKQ